jgi:glycosyltransferase involved in cell wall biosynthesis
MKICLINNLYKPYLRGGAEMAVDYVAQGLKNNGHEVFIITTKPIFREQGIGNREQGIFYVRGFYYNLNKIPKFLRLFWHIIDMFDIGSYWKVKRILKKEKPDVVMTHNLKGIGYLIPLAIKSMRIKHVHTLHDIQLLHPSGLMYYGNEKSIDGILSKLYQAFCRRLFGSPNVVISPSKWLMGAHSERGFFKDSKKVVLPNPAPAPTPRPTSLASELAGGRADPSPASSNSADRPSSRERGAKFKFLYVGLIEEHKGVLFLIEAFKKINTPFAKGGGGGFELIIVGDGAKFKKAQKLIGQNKNIKLLGRINNNEVMKLMNDSDCFIMPSLCYENSPTVIYEAMSNGLPVIASRIGGIPELLDNNGLLFEPENEDGLAEKMKWAVKNKNELRNIGEAGSRVVLNFNLEDYLNNILSF